MLFNSGVFLQFFAAFLLLYWLTRNSLTARNVLILLASYLFYGWWSPDLAAGDSAKNSAAGQSSNAILTALWHCRFLALLFATSLLDYSVGRGLDRLRTPRSRKWLLTVSIVANLGVLGFFKYADFFIESVAALLAQSGIAIQSRTLGLVLPVGISFYTFQSMSYAIDVYRRELPATRNLLHFLAYVSFFPQLVAGPIERAKHLLPQFGRTVAITTAMLEEGVWLILWGFFKKVVVADNLAPLADMAYGGTSFSAPTVLLGTVAFALQIYCDFSGYSDIARGTARVLGFDIMWNFDLPYAATSVRDFWSRWHISLSTWLRDYLYIPLGGNRLGPARTGINLIVTMLLGGLWHGAAWNFALWGLWHGAGLALQRAWTQSRVPSPKSEVQTVSSLEFGVSGGRPDANSKPETRNPKRLGPWTFDLGLWTSASRRVASWIGTLLFVLYGWLLFRARSLTQIAAMNRALIDFTIPPWTQSFVLNLVVFAAPLVLMELWQAKSRNRLVALTLPGWIRAALQGALLIAVVWFWEKKGATFIYFQF